MWSLPSLTKSSGKEDKDKDKGEENNYGNIGGGSGSGMDADDYGTSDVMHQSGALFDQMDSMMHAVQAEQQAMASMQAKFRELDSMKTQLTGLTKRLIESEQNSLNLKGNIVKIQESYSDLKKEKDGLEGELIPIRAELGKVKMLLKSENIARLSAQQENSMLKERIEQLMAENTELKRENKTIPSLMESLDILKGDLSQLRQKYKSDRKQMETTLRRMEDHSRAMETNRSESRKLAMEILDITDGHGQSKKRRAPAPTQVQGQVQGQGQEQGPISVGMAMGLVGGGGGREQWRSPTKADFDSSQDQQQQQQYQQQQYQQQQYQQQLHAAPTGIGHSLGGAYTPLGPIPSGHSPTMTGTGVGAAAGSHVSPLELGPSTLPADKQRQGQGQGLLTYLG